MSRSVYVARQPILTAANQLFGYELLYRGHAWAQACELPGDSAAARVLSDAILSIGLNNISDGRPVFLNLTRALILKDVGTLVAPASAVLEIREDVAIDAEVIAACRELQVKGYELALDDFVEDSDAEALLPYSKFVKVDVLQTSPGQMAALAARLSPRGIRLVAEKVETREMFEQACKAGYTLFQGYYFCRPRTVAAKALPARQLAYLQLMSALRDPDLSMGELENLIKHDVSLSYRVLRLVNSAAFGIRREIAVLREALILVGARTVATWAAVWAMAGLNTAPSEVAVLAMMRARTCELVGDELDNQGDRLFILGLCSLLDTMLEVPMETALDQLPLSPEIRSALLGAIGRERSILEAVIAYERGEWEDAERLAQGLGLPPAALADSYQEALRWASNLTRHSELAA